MTNPYISSIHIEYSNLNPVNIEDLSPELNIIFGDNETGKSRIRDFITWMLFANGEKFHSDRTKNISSSYKDTFKNIDISTNGEISIVSGSENNTIRQILNGSKLENRFLPANLDLRRTLTDGISYNNYSSIYSLSLDEINKDTSESMLKDQTQVEYIFGALQAKTSVSPALLIKTIKEKCESLFLENATAKKEINIVLKKIDENKKELKALKTDSKLSNDLEGAIAQLNIERIETRSEADSIELEIKNLKSMIDNIEIYTKFNELKAISPQPYNEKLVDEINDIDVLLKQSKHLITDEKDLDTLENEKQSQLKDLEQISLRLKETLDPDDTTTYLVSQEFEAVIEDQILSRSSNKSILENLKNEISNLSSKIELSNKQLEKYAAESKIQIKENTNDTSTFEKKSYKNTNTIIASILFTSLIGAGFMFKNITISAVGATALFATIIGFLLSSKNAIKSNSPIEVITTSINPTLSQVDHLQIEIEHNKQLLSLKKLEQVKLLEDIKIGSSTYGNSCLKAGFKEKIEPNHVQKYIKDFNSLTTINIQIDKTINSIKRLTSKFDSFYSTINDLAERSDYRKENDISFLSITHAQNWLDTLNGIAKQQKELKSQADVHNTKMEKLENQLLENFTTLENAKRVFIGQSSESLLSNLSDANFENAQIKEKVDEISQSIGTLSEKQEVLNKSTLIQDLYLIQEELVSELRHLHNKYKLAYISSKVCESAFNKWQENFQPEVTKKASELFSKMTNSKWESIQTDIENISQSKSQQSLFNARNAKSILDSNKLSRGASEQLYLAFRLAVMQTNKRAPFIPAMFDDIAVNFDKTRFKSIVPIINEIAEKRQIFYFTCHEWVRDSLLTNTDAKLFTLT
ncbi:MAG: AAA family ATPase [Acidimicrobiia bacterium]